MATKNTRDNTYYSFTKAFRFASFIVLIAPVLQLIWLIVAVTVKGSAWTEDAMRYTAIVASVFAILWIVTNIIMFIFAGNMRGIKSPLLIRILLILAMAFVLSGFIVYLLFAYHVIPMASDATIIVLAVLLPILEIIGYIIGAVLGGKIQKALRTK